MKLIGDNHIITNQPGSIKIVPEESDDLWLLYNIVNPNDVVSADTTRRVNLSSANKASCRVRISLDIRVAAVDYDKTSSTLRVKGKSVTPNEFVATGAFHTLELGKDKEFELKKKKKWDQESIDSLRESFAANNSADLAVVLLRQRSAEFYLIGKRETKLCEKIQALQSDKKGSNQLFENSFRTFIKHINFDSIKCVILASEGSIKDEFRRYLLSESQKLKLKPIQDNKSRIVPVNADEKGGLKEVLHDEKVMGVIKETTAATEISAMKEFTELVMGGSDRACYGWRNVEMAVEMMAIEKLLITDDLFRSSEVATRKKYVGLVEAVKRGGGRVCVYAPSHVSGEELAKMTGIAAILRFPLPDLDDMSL